MFVDSLGGTGMTHLLVNIQSASAGWELDEERVCRGPGCSESTPAAWAILPISFMVLGFLW